MEIEELEAKILNGEELSEEELKECVDELGRETSFEENRRWTRTAKSIIKINDRYFAIEWEQGLTECQENSYYNQPYEVELVEERRLIDVSYYKKI